MKKTKLWMPLVAIATAGASMLPLVSLASCGNKVDVKVKTFAALKEALANEEMKKIGLEADITITPENSSEFGLKIGRPVEIYGNGHKISWIDTESEYTDPSDYFKHMIEIDYDNSSAAARVNILFNNVEFIFKTASNYNAVICATNIQNCNLRFEDGCKITSSAESDFHRSYGLLIKPDNKTTSSVEIYDSTIDAWGAVYNQGSNVTFYANKSTFIGTNDSAEAWDTFATIVASDYPIKSGAAGAHSFSVNNQFDFYNCTLTAKVAEGITGDLHQFIIENRSAAHNLISISDDSTCQCMVEGATIWFINVAKDLGYGINDANIESYCTAGANPDVPKDLIGKKTADEYYKIYGESYDASEATHSHIDIKNQSILTYSADKNIAAKTGYWVL